MANGGGGIACGSCIHYDKDGERCRLRNESPVPVAAVCNNWTNTAEARRSPMAKIIPPRGPIWALLGSSFGTFPERGSVPIWNGRLPELRYSEEHGHDLAVITDDDGVEHEFATVEELVDFICEVKGWPAEGFKPFNYFGYSE